MINPTLKRLGLTQTEAAAILGISHHTLSRYSRNALPAPRWLLLILAAWEAHPEALAKARGNA